MFRELLFLFSALVYPFLTISSSNAQEPHRETRATLDYSYSGRQSLNEFVQVVEVTATPAVTISGSFDLSKTTESERSARVFEQLAAISKYCEKNKLKVSGPPVVVNRKTSDSEWQYDIMSPIESSDTFPPPKGEIFIREMPSGRSIVHEHQGPKSELLLAYKKLENGCPSTEVLQPLTWEQYITDPSSTPVAEMKIRVFRTVRPIRK
jgi:effector-binding domain-containing protein